MAAGDLTVTRAIAARDLQARGLTETDTVVLFKVLSGDRVADALPERVALARLHAAGLLTSKAIYRPRSKASNAEKRAAGAEDLRLTDEARFNLFLDDPAS